MRGEQRRPHLAGRIEAGKRIRLVGARIAARLLAKVADVRRRLVVGVNGGCGAGYEGVQQEGRRLGCGVHLENEKNAFLKLSVRVRGSARGLLGPVALVKWEGERVRIVVHNTFFCLCVCVFF